jgi:transposase InsO family protein
VIFIDDFSKKTWVYFLKKKLDALFVFKTFKTKIEKEIGKVIKVLKSDNGGEFINSQFMKYCQDSKIRRQFSQAYTLQQNGVVERKN